MQIQFYDTFSILDRLENSEFEDPRWYEMNRLAYYFSASQDFDRTAIINRVKEKIKVLPHQINVALNVLNKMGHRAILADEVGLGKTIEAGIILKEYFSRKLVDSALILAPAPLVLQWKGELEEKFNESFVTHYDKDFSDFSANKKLICSLDTAKQPQNAMELYSRDWDLVIVDEAHRLRNANTIAYNFVNNLSKKFFLLLTATPIQNSVIDLYNLSNLLKPGILGTKKEFLTKYVKDKKARDLANVESLKSIISQIMIRNRRSEVGIKFTERHVSTHRFQATEKEKEVYDALINYVIESNKALNESKDNKTPMERNMAIFTLMLLERECVSSTFALRETLQKMLFKEENYEKRAHLDEIYEMCADIKENTKCEQLFQLLNKINVPSIVFTQFIPTQDYIARRLEEEGKEVIIFNGKMSSHDKEMAISDFKRKGDVLVCTDSGSEGRNLQFCNVLINYDLPWNPMRVEQRIGRVHRIGQNRDVHILNFTIAQTIEDYILTTLYEKIDLATTAIGEMDLILSNISESNSFERRIFEISTKVHEKSEFSQEMEKLQGSILKSKELAENIKKLDEKVLETFDLSVIGEKE